VVAQQKLVTPGALLAGVVHELNTPLGSSLMMACAMQELEKKSAPSACSAAICNPFRKTPGKPPA
jgi:signal transduction histidine kinase